MSEAISDWVARKGISEDATDSQLSNDGGGGVQGENAGGNGLVCKQQQKGIQEKKRP